MKIISKDKDYYDHAMSYGVDETQVFVRKPEFVEKQIPSNWAFDFRSSRDLGEIYYIEGKNGPIQIHRDIFFLGFCGEVHLGCRFSTHVADDLTEQVTYYSPEEVAAHIAEIWREYKVVKQYWSWYSSGAEEDAKDVVQTMKRLTSIANSAPLKEWFFELNVPLYVFPAGNYSREKMTAHYGENYKVKEGKFVIMTHPILKEVDFYRVENPYDCYQKVNQYRFGVLGNIENIENKQSDIDKVDSHGFDAKYGFRTRPGSGKKRKKKK